MSGVITQVGNAANQAIAQGQLLAAEAQSKVQSLLSPSGVVGSAVSDILGAASDVIAIENTASAALANFVSQISDPIQASFSQGQPYAGTFITAPTAVLTPLTLINQALSATQSAISALSCEQLEALAERVGFQILDDTGLAQAMAFLFNEVSSIASLAYSIALDAECLCGCTDITPYTSPESSTAITYTVPSITPNPNTTNLMNFISQISVSFANTPGISGVAASVWVDGLSISVSGSGTPIIGVPGNINNGTYNDITNSASGLVPSGTPPAMIIDYSYQQNLLNVTLALAIDNGLIATIETLLASSMVTPVTYQVILGRLGSVCQRGDTDLFLALINALGVNNVPNTLELTSLLISSLSPSDLPNTTLSKTVFYAGGTPAIINTNTNTPSYSGGVVITTTTNTNTLADTITNVNNILTTLGLTAEEVYSQSTCDSVFCSNSLLNIPMLKAANQPIVTALFGQSVIQMANMFA